MSSQEEEIDQLIDGYITGTLAGKDLEDFEKRMDEDNALRSEVQLQKDIKQAIAEDDIHDIRSAIRDVIVEKREAGKPLYFKLAAAIVPLIIGGIFAYNFWLGGVSNEELMSRYLYPYENLLTVRSDQGTNGSDIPASQANLNAAMAHYDNGDYSNALKYFERIDKRENELIALYAGISYIYTGNLDSAFVMLKIPSENDGGIYQYTAMYYTALAKIKDNNLKEGKKILQVLVEKSTQPYKGYALEILNDL